MAIFKKTRDNKYQLGVEKKEPWYTTDENVNSHSTVSIKNSTEVHQKVKNTTTNNPAVPLLNIYLKEIKTNFREKRSPMFGGTFSGSVS